MKVLDIDGLEYYNNYIENKYLSKSGGTMTGNLTMSGNQLIEIGNSHADGTGGWIARTQTGLRIASEAFGYSAAGAYIDLNGQSSATGPGNFIITARSDSSTSKALTGRADGTLTWNGNSIITSAGGTVTGNIVLDKSGTSPVQGTPIILPIVYKTKTTASGNAVYDTTPFFVFPTSDTSNNGTGFGIQTGGALVIGGGESPRALVGALTLNGGTENAYLTADSTVYIVTNGNTIANRKTFAFTTDGKLEFPDGSKIWIA